MWSITVPSILSPKPHILPTTATCRLWLVVTIAAPTHSTCSSRYSSLVIPKANSPFDRFSFQFSAANDWNELQKSLKLETYISLTNFLSISCQRSLPIIAPVHSPSVNSTPNYLIPILLFIYLKITLLHIYHTSVYLLNCNYFGTMAYLLPYLPNLTTFAHTVHILFYCVIDCMFVYPMCNSVLFVFVLYFD